MCATAAMLPTTMFINIFQWEFLLMPSIKYNFCNFDDTYKITNIIYNFFTIAKLFHWEFWWFFECFSCIIYLFFVNDYPFLWNHRYHFLSQDFGFPLSKIYRVVRKDKNLWLIVLCCNILSVIFEKKYLLTYIFQEFYWCNMYLEPNICLSWLSHSPKKCQNQNMMPSKGVRNALKVIKMH